MNEAVELSPLDDITGISFSNDEEYFYPETFVCHWCKNPWHWPWFATRAHMAAASAASNGNCLRQLLARMPGLKTLKGRPYAEQYVWETGVIYIASAQQKMRTHRAES